LIELESKLMITC